MMIRPATPSDAEGMKAVHDEIFAAGLRKVPGDLAQVRANYIEAENRIDCFVAVDDEGRILGFQSLRHSWSDNPYGVAEGWGIIGTHVSPRAARQGVGSGLFRATLAAAKAVGLENIDASIGADNPLGQAYYEAMGFRTYRTPDGLVCKVYRVDHT
ncbi:GNAT family N-acetyltransferase [Agrobacterium sp. BA1120]|uniref:GNAT family N-acetyltransferase n=1 Tax=Agrobacterium sp. BA1120 TaxID=3228927 RepID=UPI003369CD2F